MSTSGLTVSRQLLVGEIIKRAARRSPHTEAFIDDQQRVTYRQFEQRIMQMAGWLQQAGAGVGKNVGFILKNGLPFVEVFFGISLTKAAGVPINFRLTGEEIVYIVNNSDSHILFIEKEFAETISSLRSKMPNVEHIVVVGSDTDIPGMIGYETIGQQTVVYQEAEQASDEEACMLVYTSGTTGRPKGAVLTHKNISTNGMNMIWEFDYGFRQIQLVAAPLFHSAAMSMLIYAGMTMSTTILHRDFNPVKVLQAIQTERVQILPMVPAMWNFLFQVPNLAEYDVSSLTHCITGGAITPVELKKRIMSTFPNAGIYDAFGQSEMSPATACLHPEDTLRKTTTVGRPVVNVEIRVVDEHGRDVGENEVGEIIYRGPTVMKEYYRDPQATAEAFSDGWFHSGDLVRVDEEGFITIVDRKKDMIISGGENIYPAEIEEVLYRHPAVLEAAVIGVPDGEWGEKVRACIVLKPGQALTAEEVVAYCTASLASYKKPKEIQFLDALPRNAGGKVLKRTLRDR
ncbi:MAG: acyl-CoA synthetase [Clostridia bacterium]